MGSAPVIIEYASGKTQQARLPAPWLMLALTAVGIASIFLPFVYNTSAASALSDLCRDVLRNQLSLFWEAKVLALDFALAPVILYVAARTCWGGRLRLVERGIGYAVSALAAAPVLFMTLRMIYLIASSGRPSMLPEIVVLGIASMAALLVLSAGAWLSLLLRQSHKEGVALFAFLAACYVANGIWALLIAFPPDPGFPFSNRAEAAAPMCAAVCAGFAVELALLAVRDRQWRRRLGRAAG